MNNRNIKIIIIAGLSVLAIIIVLIILLPIKSAHTIVNPIGDEILMPQLTNNGQFLYYFENKSNFLKRWNINSNQVESIVQLNNPTIDWIKYSPDTNQALVHRTNPENALENQTWLIDLNAKKIIKELPSNISTIAWRADSQKIVYHHIDFNDETNDLVVSSPDGTNSQIITPLLENYYQFYWTSPDQIIYLPLATEEAPGNILTININDKQPKYLAQNVYIGNSSKLNDKSILFELTMSTEADYQLYLYQTLENKFTYFDSSAKANPIAIIDSNDAFVGTRLVKNKLSVVKFIDNQKNTVKIKLKDIQNLTNLFYSNNAIYFVANGSLYVFNN